MYKYINSIDIAGHRMYYKNHPYCFAGSFQNHSFTSYSKLRTKYLSLTKVLNKLSITFTLYYLYIFLSYSLL